MNINKVWHNHCIVSRLFYIKMLPLPSPEYLTAQSPSFSSLWRVCTLAGILKYSKLIVNYLWNNCEMSSSWSYPIAALVFTLLKMRQEPFLSSWKSKNCPTLVHMATALTTPSKLSVDFHHSGSKNCYVFEYYRTRIA